jgi:hypothetical protein
MMGNWALKTGLIRLTKGPREEGRDTV